jgi:hypothetical protein
LRNWSGRHSEEEKSGYVYLAKNLEATEMPIDCGCVALEAKNLEVHLGKGPLRYEGQSSHCLHKEERSVLHGQNTFRPPHLEQAEVNRSLFLKVNDFSCTW